MSSRTQSGRAGLLARLRGLPGLSEIGFSLVAIAAALGVGALLIMAFGYDVGRAFAALASGAFGSVYAVSQTLMRTTPLLFAGLGVAVAFRAGLFNIGVEGQLYWGGLASALAALALAGLPLPIVILGALLAGAAAGAAWGWIPGFLKAKTGAHEVITTIMLNTIAVLGTSYLTASYFKEPGPVDQTARIPEGSRMPELISGTDISLDFAVGILVVAFIAWFFRRTSLGYDFRAVGLNAAAAEYGSVRSSRIIIASMSLGGALAGLAGSSVVLTQLDRFVTGFSPGYGFTGIAIAVLGRGNPWGVLLSALLFGALSAGGMSMQLFAQIPNDLMTVVQGLVILFVAAPAALTFISTRLRRLREGRRVE